MAPAWSEADIPDLNGVTAVVTGANRGIGLEVVRGLAAKGARVVLAVRRPESGEAAAAPLRATSPRASLEVMRLDLADDLRGGDYIGPSGWLGVRGSPAPARSSRRSHDEALALRLWRVSESLTGVRYTFAPVDRR
jgi:NAD(P)-dependent dehydrogenase (short-subunit alcohol dehydrogenase family)